MNGLILASGSASGIADKHPGIMIVRPSLHHETDENAATFKRWTVMHFNDLLHCTPPTSSTRGVTHALRYINTDGQMLYTILADDISVWQTPPYYATSRRLDLENTREVVDGENNVLLGEHGFGNEPMVWQLVDAAFGIFKRHAETSLNKGDKTEYQALPHSQVSSTRENFGAPESTLVTLTYTSSCASKEGDDAVPPEPLAHVKNQVLHSLSAKKTDDRKYYHSMYRHDPGAQPDMHPTIAEGADGNGSWVALTRWLLDVGLKQEWDYFDLQGHPSFCCCEAIWPLAGT
ncbi:hypothetical protein C7974DRAFT_391115 [Boeremia exigua]|uniref:uncharacterized protein n=1 Tax=Boeremia exigua TaxID=749465 RepID=UPI001E8CD552|nr:uncharacterized protein C7974DRAFT_391115 [Boeremia exigua]KAH6638229.1 hypothetical protein C7974DRAFT_391115 [Boeremia exigua]